MVDLDPQQASDYDDRVTAAVRSVFVEIGQILGSYQGKFAVVGGAVPWLLLNQAEMQHVGTQDVDLSLDAEALKDGEYAKLVDPFSGKGTAKTKVGAAFSLSARSQPKTAVPTLTSSSIF